MFKKKQKDCLVVTKNDQTEIVYPLLEIPFNEAIILQYSEKFFSDSIPCFIHRGAVINRLIFELQEVLSSQPIKWIDLPETAQSALNLNDVATLKIEKR